MILDRFFQFTGGSPAPGNNDGATDVPTTGAQTSSQIIDVGVGSTTNLAIPSGASGGGYRDLGIGDDPALKITAEVTTVFAGGTSLQLSLQGAPDNGSNAPGSFVTWWSTPVYTLAQLVVGARLFDIDWPRPPAAVAQARFFQLAYTIVGTFTGGGALIANGVLDRVDQIFNAANNQTLGGYQPGITIAN